MRFLCPTSTPVFPHPKAKATREEESRKAAESNARVPEVRGLGRGTLGHAGSGGPIPSGLVHARTPAPSHKKTHPA
jgi:hypothetical protein